MPYEGRGFVVNDPFGIAHLYVGETAEVIAISNRASLVARAITEGRRSAERDIWAAGWLAFTGWAVGPNSGYAEVKTLPLGAFLELNDPSGLEIRNWNRTIWESPDDDPRLSDVESRVEFVNQAILANIRAVLQLPAPTKIAHLTGGKDTRLILAVMMAEGIQDSFAFMCSALPDTPDLIVVSGIAHAFGLDGCLGSSNTSPLHPLRNCMRAASS